MIRLSTPIIRTVPISLIILLHLSSAHAAGKNVIYNGGFEEGPEAIGEKLTLFWDKEGLIPGWKVITGSVDLIGTYWLPSEISRSIDLNGENSGGIGQTFGTVPGKRYLVLFDLSGNPDDAPTVKNLQVSAAGQWGSFGFETTGRSRTDMGWIEQQWEFVANADLTTLEFLSQGPADSGAGPAIDNVRVYELEPPPELENLVFNGSFEKADPSIVAVPAGDTSIATWTVTQGAVDLANPSMWKPSDGDRSVDLDGAPGAGAIAQTIPTVQGNRYTVLFDLSGNSDCAPVIKTMQVSAASQSNTFIFDTTDKANANMEWWPQQWEFKAEGTETTLTFSSLNPPDSACGAVIDNVRVHAAHDTDDCAADGADGCMLEDYPVIIDMEGGDGTVTTTPGDGTEPFVCEADAATCEAMIKRGEEVTLIAEPEPGYAFVGWEGGCEGEDTMCILTLADATGVTAIFEAVPTSVPYTLATAKAGNGSGTVSGDGLYAAGQTVELVATPAKGSRFVSWKPSPCANTFAMPDKDLTCTATFTRILYTVKTEVDDGGALSPASRKVAHGKTTTFTVTPSTGYAATVTGCKGKLVDKTYTTGAITADCTVKATFARIETFPPNGTFPMNWLMPPTSDAPWTVAKDWQRTGAYSLRSGKIAHDQQSVVEVSGHFKAGTVSFHVKVSSEANYDGLIFSVDGNIRAVWSGENTGASKRIRLSAGQHTLTWAYVKDTATSSGKDAAWIDDVVLPALQ